LPLLKTIKGAILAARPVASTSPHNNGSLMTHSKRQSPRLTRCSSDEGYVQKTLLPLLAAALVIMGASSAHAISVTGCSGGALSTVPGISATVVVNGECFDFGSQITLGTGDLGLLPTQTLDVGDGAAFKVSGLFDPDPTSTFTFGSILPAGFGPFTFDAFFSVPVVGGPFNAAKSSGTLSITTTGAAIGQVSAGTFPFYISGLGDATNLGVNTGTGNCTASSPPSPITVSCDPPDAFNTFAPFSPTFLTAHLSYTHNTVGTGTSTVSWTGAVELFNTTSVPEPPTSMLLLVGLAMFGISELAIRRTPAGRFP
jgi:hypothetical protein